MPQPYDPVLDFWFRELGPTDWFGAGERLDPVIRERFGALHGQAVAGDLDGWAAEPLGRLALIIVLDQFSRQIYRGTAQAFAADPKAQQLTLDGLAAKEDEQLAFAQRQFLYMPLMHSEDPQVQKISLERFAALQAYADYLVQFANGHADEIARYGRFPLRNAALGRASSDEETAFLTTAKPR